MFTSPHLVTTRERFCIDGSMISEEAFLEAFNWLSAQLRQYRKTKPDYSPTYFERLFFMGIYVFARADVEITILETGLGGRLDTTNVVKNPSVSVITEIGLDHMAYLGDTLEKIAAEKAGIFKAGVPVVFSDRKVRFLSFFVKKRRNLAASVTACQKMTTKSMKFRKNSLIFLLSVVIMVMVD